MKIILGKSLVQCSSVLGRFGCGIFFQSVFSVRN
jgi:hypothetical protein